MSEELQELALEAKGCVVSYSSCGYEGVASSKNIIDGSRSTFWVTTGLYPQSFIISFAKSVEFSRIIVRSYCVKGMVIEKASTDMTQGFEVLQSLDLKLTDLHHQVSKIDINPTSIKQLRFTITDGYQEICAIYKVEVLGKQIRFHS